MWCGAHGVKVEEDRGENLQSGREEEECKRWRRVNSPGGCVRGGRWGG